ncbi:MAG: YciI family protein [Xanthomonadales bacterium]|nr:YciI family protein [Gammaproteobacteria bacterium]MBT8051505.1 YciI family protein [Gammaproteobacteria bacterium]MBT8056390.1 YciI family protein [Gammaproteobacteria bacterium]NNJ80290.1 YciI family protein [Xanthomonadales bacterium]NNL04242.1 YciI family protein [Xanthomonadales bacterium]
MWYVIYSRDRDNALQARLNARPDHLERVSRLVDEGRILLAGPRPAIDSPDPGPAGFEGSLIVADFDSLEDARAWAESDPYVLAGVYESVEISPFIQVLP